MTAPPQSVLAFQKTWISAPVGRNAAEETNGGGASCGTLSQGVAVGAPVGSTPCVGGDVAVGEAVGSALCVGGVVGDDVGDNDGAGDGDAAAPGQAH
jgi:hypothetical protein